MLPKPRGLGKKIAGFPGESWTCTSKTYFQTNHVLRHKLFKMIGFGAWKLTWGNHFVRRRFLFFFWVHRCLLGNREGRRRGITPSLVPNPFSKPLTMDVCKLNCWVPYKMVALTSPGKCAGGHIYIYNIYIYNIIIYIYITWGLS